MKKIRNARERIQDTEVKKVFDKYKMYTTELDIYEQYRQENPSSRIYRYKIARLYRENGIEFKSKKSLEERFRKFASSVEKVKQENEGIDLHDIRTQKNRNTISALMSQTQKGREIKPADLDPIAILENFSLCVAIGAVDEKSMSVQEALQQFEVTEEEFIEAQNSYKNYEQSGMLEHYNRRMEQGEKGKPSTIVHYTAGCLEITPAQARNDLAMIGILKEKFIRRKKVIEKYYDDSISQVVIDRIMMDSKLTPEEKQEKIEQLKEDKRRQIDDLVKEANTKGGKYEIRENSQEGNNVINMIPEEDNERGCG